MKKDNPLDAIATLIFLIILASLKKKEYPKLLYHYTNAHGALGIMDSSRLWSTGAYVLNDTREIEYGLDLLKNALKAARTAGKRNKKLSSFLADLESLTHHPSGRVERINSIFITSFCEQSDVLRQWRAYSSGGDGYCLAFDPREMENLKVKQAPDGFMLDLVKVEYRPETQTALLEKSLKEFGEAFESEDNFAFLHETSFALLAWEILFSTVLTFKHPSFEDENEWRLIVRPNPVLSRQQSPPSDLAADGIRFKPCFTAVGGYIKHYVELEPNDKNVLPIKSVCLGPKIHEQHTEVIFRMLAMTRGYKLEGISRSACQLR